jgi:hypothetical protein
LEEEEEPAALWLAEEMWLAVKAGVAAWRVVRFMAADPRMVAECFLVGLVRVRLPTKAVLWPCLERSMAAPMGAVTLLRASM